MHALLEILVSVAAFGSAEKPERHPPARWRTVGVLWVALLAALLMGRVVSASLSATGTGWMVAWVVAASIVLLVTGSCADVALARRRRGLKKREERRGQVGKIYEDGRC